MLRLSGNGFVRSIIKSSIRLNMPLMRFFSYLIKSFLPYLAFQHILYCWKYYFAFNLSYHKRTYFSPPCGALIGSRWKMRRNFRMRQYEQYVGYPVTYVVGKHAGSREHNLRARTDRKGAAAVDTFERGSRPFGFLDILTRFSSFIQKNCVKIQFASTTFPINL